MKKLASLLIIAMAFISCSEQEETIDNTIVGKVFTGYQGWFNCAGDGSPRDAWVHWGGNPPSPGKLTIEAYPDISEYAPSSLFQTGFANLGDGQPAKLFSSYKTDVIDTHFRWMHEYGIDGAALQRFLGPVLRSKKIKDNRDSVSVRLKSAAEKYGVLYYLMYDMAPNNVEGFKGDVEHMENDIKFMDSPYYAHQNGKPVICLWGIGFDHRDGEGHAANSQVIIDWLHEKGYYVIGGVPSRWRETNGEHDVAPGYEQVFASLDMISPWTVGRYNGIEAANEWKETHLKKDKAKCDELGIDYQPVIFSGFAWSNWNGGAQNAYPRMQGEFLWQQVENVIEAEIPTIYVAMFDEYDEATNIMKMADSFLGIPTDQYFLTTSADGKYISSDFYLRLAGKAGKVLKGLEPVTPNVSIPFTEGPIYFRTSNEPGFDALPDWIDSQDELGVSNVEALTCANMQEQAHVGNYALKFSGKAQSNEKSKAAMKVYDVNIPVFADLQLTFWSNPTNTLSKYASIDLVLKDGTTLSSKKAQDRNGLSIAASQGRGEENSWNKTECNLGEWLNSTEAARDTIDKIIVVFNHPSKKGEFTTYFDDISIFRME